MIQTNHAQPPRAVPSRARLAGQLLLCLCAAIPLPALAAGPVQGFIVRLHDDAQAGHPSTTSTGAAAGDAAELRRASAASRRQRLAAVLRERALPLGEGEPVSERWQRLHAGASLSATEARWLEARLRADPRVAAVVPDVREQRLAVTPSDTRFAEQWWLQARADGRTGVADFAQGWTRSTGAPVAGAVAHVAVLDSGISSHPELNARLLPGWDFVSDGRYSRDGNGRDNDPADPGDAITAAEIAARPDAYAGCPPQAQSSWHGSIIAGQLAAVTNNGVGVAAANWQGRVLPVRVAGQCGAAVSDIIDGLRWAAGLAVPGTTTNPNPARLIVLSYGSDESCDVDSSTPTVRDTARLYVEALAEVRAAGATVFAAAGNQRRAVGRPAACEGAFAVAALNRDGFKATYSNFGPQIRLATPGGDDATGGSCDVQLGDGGLVSTGNLGTVDPGAPGYVAASGTSFAAPAVAATAAMMLALNPALSRAQVEAGLVASARRFVQVPLLGDCSADDNPGRCTCTASSCGAGQLDADQALAYAAAPDAYRAPVSPLLTLRDARIEACAAILGRPVPPVPAPVPAPTPTPTPVPTPVPDPAASAGGGASSIAFMFGLCLAVAALRRQAA